MLLLVYRQLRHQLLRSALTATALAAVVAVILVLEGFYAGMLEQLRSAVINRQADLIVTQAGVANMTTARSILPQYTRAQVESVPGVAAADPLTGISVIYEDGGLRTPMFLFVYDRGGGPANLVDGRAPTEPRQIAIDRSLAKNYGLSVGDPFILSDFEFKVSGVTSGAAAFFTPFGFARYDDLIDFYFESDIAADISTFPLLSFLLVHISPEADRKEVAAVIENTVEDGDVFLPSELAASDESLGRVLFGPIMRLMVGVAYIIGVLVTAIIMFAAVHGRRSDLGVLKAVGFTAGFLGLSVIAEALLLALVAIPVGVLLAMLIGVAIEYIAPLYVILVDEPAPMLRTSIACLLFAAIGALLPIRLIRRVDPGMVFRS